jgi:hypothetical protein
MILVFVTKDGYYVAGEGVEASFKCSPATDERGYPIFNEIHHTYKVLFLALREVARKRDIQGDVLVYNDTRIVDELNGDVQPLDDVCRKWQQTIRRELVPAIRSLVFFRKKNAEYIKSQVKSGEVLLTPGDPAKLNELATKLTQLEKEAAQSFKTRAIARFKRTWKNE